jgi:predicted GH43/DUF377 family glycosyl hydrolase
MTTNLVPVKRVPPVLKPDQSRVLLRPFLPGDALRVRAIIARILDIPEYRIRPLLEEVLEEFSPRHQDIRAVFLERFEKVRTLLPVDADPSEQRRLLIGSYCVNEYSLESAALFNPSIVPDPDQSSLPAGTLRFILSLRATGEGHISSITFRSGVIHADGRIEVVPPSNFLSEPHEVKMPLYEKPLFERKLTELGLTDSFVHSVMAGLPESFAWEELGERIETELRRSRALPGPIQGHHNSAQGIKMLARSNYEVWFQPGQKLSERILFPATPSQRNGIEDARFTHFRNDDGTYCYYATFTAYDGQVVLPELVETSDFLHFQFITLNGPAAENKGMAIFPRKINGRFAMLSRQDNESIYLMFSDNMHFWNEHTLLLSPAYPWELVQIGNCGSPIETDAGWLVLSHGVGPVRKYCIGAFLLDRDNPAKVIGRLREPLLRPVQEEREGYVPNVVYTCGALLHNGQLVIPYGMADYATRFATVPLAEVLAAMT